MATGLHLDGIGAIPRILRGIGGSGYHIAGTLHPAQSTEIAAATHAILGQDNPPSALFTVNNRNTIGACRTIRTRAVTTAIGGFDGFEFVKL